jgi:hypothetical protein
LQASGVFFPSNFIQFHSLRREPDKILEIVIEDIPLAAVHQLSLNGIKSDRLVLIIMPFYQLIELSYYFRNLAIDLEVKDVRFFYPVIIIALPILLRNV